MSEFRILHLSDLHMGNPKWGTDSAEVLKPLLRDLAEEVKKHGLPNLVVFSGDLVFGFQDGKPLKMEEQFARVEDWLKSVSKALGFRDGQLPLFIVPGNHDVNRDSVTRGDQLLTDQLNPQEVDNLLFKNDKTWQQLIKRLSEWKAFALKYTKTLKVHWNPDWLLSDIIIKNDNNKIGIAGINSAWASYQSAETGKLWIGERQAQKAWSSIESADFRILVTHHPLSWMHPDEKGPLEMKIASNFNLHLHGHEHLQWFNDSRGHLRVAAGACYQGSRMPASYSWIFIDCQKKRVRVKFRKWEPTGKGGWVAFHIPDRTDKNGIMTTELPFDQNNIGMRGEEPVSRVHSTVEAQPVTFKTITDGFTLCKSFRDRFSVQWEAPSDTRSSNVNLVYWPVRLRYPNVVHAAQAFIAAGLQQKGAEVYLWLDDFGMVDASIVKQFREKVKAWFERVGGSGDGLHIHSMGKLLETDQGKKIWETLKKWFMEQQSHKLGDVLRVSKLLGVRANGTDYEKLLEKSPKRLLSPPIVWTCLVDTLQRKTGGGVVTLGGIDEQALWAAWRRCIGDSSRQVGHVYVSTLMASGAPYDMEAASSWAGIHNVEDALRAELDSLEDKEDFLKDDKMAHWCYEHCVSLPNFLAGKTATPSWDQVKQIDSNGAIRLISRAMEPWIF